MNGHLDTITDRETSPRTTVPIAPRRSIRRAVVQEIGPPIRVPVPTSDVWTSYRTAIAAETRSHPQRDRSPLSLYLIPLAPEPLKELCGLTWIFPLANAERPGRKGDDRERQTSDRPWIRRKINALVKERDRAPFGREFRVVTSRPAQGSSRFGSYEW